MSRENIRPVVLLILDGWGFTNVSAGNAIAAAHTPFYDQICREFPMATLAASGSRVGLPASVAAGPEVGHLNLGTGRVVVSDAERIAAAIESGSFNTNETLIESFSRVNAAGKTVHLVGLLSEAGVNASFAALITLLETAKRRGITNINIHCILDGVDSPSGNAEGSINRLQEKLASLGVGRIASLCGRYFGMDSGGHWERTARAFTMLVHGEGDRAGDAAQAARTAYQRGISEEFLPPVIIEQPEGKLSNVRDGDLVIFFNHRPEGIRQLVRSLTSAAPNNAGGTRQRVEILCLTDYDSSLDVKVLFPQDEQRNVLSHVLSASGVPNCRITESERTQHLTYFFDGGSYHSIVSEREFHIPSPPPEKYEFKPELSSFKLADCVRRELRDHAGMFIVNLPAADVVAQTGNIETTVHSIQFLDTCLGGIIESVHNAGAVALITSSHSNCENLFSDQPNLNPVPFHLIDQSSKNVRLRDDGALEDVAPTVLGLLGIEKPSEMTGSDLRAT